MRFDQIAQTLGSATRVPLDRRGFLKASALAGGGMTLGLWPALDATAQDAAKKPSLPSAFITIHPDNTVDIYSNRLEFGQGTQTALPMLIAEELDVPFERINAKLAPAGEAYKDPFLGFQVTGSSTAIKNSWVQYREIGASARAMLMQAAARTWNVPVSEVRTDAGYCIAGSKRASYGSLAVAAAKLPVPDKVTLKDPTQYTLIGKPMRRVDTAAASTGRKQFGIDVMVKHQIVAVIARPPTFTGGKVAKFDASKALAIRGVKAVYEVPTDRGGTGLAVFAEGYWPAKQGRDALVVDWTPGASAGLSSDGLIEQYKGLAKAPKLTAVDWQAGGSRGALDKAPRKLVAEFAFPYLSHSPLEPLNCVIDLHADRCTVWIGSQSQTFDQLAVAQTTGLKPDQVTLITVPAGGGFGRRAVTTSDYVREAAGVAKVWRDRGHTSPVKVMWSREDDIKGGYYRPLHVHRVEIGFDDRGGVLAWDHAIVGQSIGQGTGLETLLVKNGVDDTMIEGVAENVYAMPLRLRVEHPVVPVPVLWWRSVGHTHTAFVMETLIDEAAQTAGQDPVQYRLARYGDKHPRHTQALQLAVAKSGYGKMALPQGRAWGVAVHESFDTVVAHVAEVSIEDKRPVVHRVTAGVHCNRVVNPMTAEAQIQGGVMFGLSMTLPGNAITLKDGQVEQSQFTDYTPSRMVDTPVVDVHFVPSEDAPTGLGEPGACVIAPAVANAVARLTGQRLRKLPFELI